MLTDPPPAPPPPDPDETLHEGLRESSTELVSDLAGETLVTGLVATYINVLKAADEGFKPAPPSDARRGRRVYKAVSGKVVDMAGSANGIGATVLIRGLFFLLEAWILFVRRSPGKTLLATGLLALSIYLAYVGDKAWYRNISLQQAAIARATVEAKDAQYRSQLADLRVSMALDDPVLYGRGTRGSALRCLVTLSNPGDDRQVARLTMAYVSLARPAPGQRAAAEQPGSAVAHFDLDAGDTGIASKRGEIVMLETGIPGDDLDRLSVTNVTLTADWQQSASIDLEPVPTGCNFQRP